MYTISSNYSLNLALELIQLPKFRLFAVLAIFFIIPACGGGSGGSSSNSNDGNARLTLIANPATVERGQSTTVTWRASNSISCRALEGWTTNTRTDGTITIGPLNKSTTYIMECLSKEGGTLRESIEVSVDELRPNTDTPTAPNNPSSPNTPNPIAPIAPNPTVGSVELSWKAPSSNQDGSALTDLAGYTIYYGSKQNSLNQIININAPGITTYVINNLPVITYYFSISAKDNNNNESLRSNIASKIIR